MKQALLLVGCVFTLACGSADTSKAEDSQTEAATNGTAAGRATTKSASSPCAFVAEPRIKEVLGIPTDAPAAVEDVMQTYPTCIYKWETMPVSVRRSVGGREISLDFPSEAMIVLVEDASEQMFETSTTVYKDGVDQAGIGDMAVWGAQMSQLTFLAAGTMIHLHVRVSSDATINQAKAQELAALIVARLRS